MGLENKLRGHLYEIVEVYPAERSDTCIRTLTTHDRLEDAQKVLDVLESVNYNFTCYAIMLRPIWDDRSWAKTEGWDANGSPVI